MKYFFFNRTVIYSLCIAALDRYLASDDGICSVTSISQRLLSPQQQPTDLSCSASASKSQRHGMVTFYTGWIETVALHVCSVCGKCRDGKRQKRLSVSKKSKSSSRATLAHWAVLISVSLALSQTPPDTARPRIRGRCIAWCACLLPSFRWYSFDYPRMDD